MKINRYKKANKYLNFYAVNFGFHKPFQLLIDGTFCYSAIGNRVQIKEEIPKYLGGDVKLLTTPCVIMETERLGHKAKGAMLIVKSFGIHKCGHNKTPLSGSDCLLSMISDNSNRYIIATQDKDLQHKIELMPGIPLLYFNRTSAVLKPPSEETIKIANREKAKTVELSERQENILSELKFKVFGEKALISNTEDDCIYPKKRKGPNPLSCKRKKTSLTDDGNNRQNDDKNTERNKRKRKRKRIKLSKHVKEELFKYKLANRQE